MDRGAWPFFVDGVTCLVVSVSVREEEREKRRDTMKEKRREKMKGKMKEKMKRDRGKKCLFFFKKVSESPNPPDELAQNVSKKSPSDELFLHFSSKVQNLTVFSFIYMIRIRFFVPGELIQNGFRRA